MVSKYLDTGAVALDDHDYRSRGTIMTWVPEESTIGTFGNQDFGFAIVIKIMSARSPSPTAEHQDASFGSLPVEALDGSS